MNKTTPTQHHLTSPSRTPRHHITNLSRTPRHHITSLSRTPRHRLTNLLRTPRHRLGLPAVILLLSMLAGHARPTFAQNTLDGQWQLVASPVGVEGEGGIMTSGWDTIDFTATLSADGNTLECHADNFVSRNGHAYPMDWRIAIERDGNKVRLGWICNDQQPASSQEFQEPATAYALAGKNTVDGEHRYIYLLSYNIDTGREEGMTLWSGWQEQQESTFTLPQNQQIDAIVSTDIPYSSFIGYVDSWASARIKRPSSDGITQRPTVSARHSSAIYDLQGRRLSQKPIRGLYIQDGKKRAF